MTAGPGQSSGRQLRGVQLWREAGLPLHGQVLCWPGTVWRLGLL